MAKSFRDIAQDLRSKPGLRLPNGKFLDRLFIVQATEPASAYEACVKSTPTAVTKAIAVASPATVVSNADYAIGITGSWGNTFTVRVGGTAQDASARLCIPQGSTQSQFLARLFERLANEHSVSPSFTSGGALAVFNTSGTEAVVSVPSGFLSLASATANFVSPQAAPQYRTGAPHPDCDFLRLFQVESSGRDDHNVNLTLFYRVDLDLLASAMGTTGDALRSRTGYEISEPHDSATYPRVQWTFEIVNPESYNRPANGTAHPWVAGCIFTNESRTEQQGATIITRIYEPIPGPTIATEATSLDGYASTTYQKRVLRDSPGSPPSPPNGQVAMRQSLVDDASLYAASWVVECRSKVDREEGTSTSAGGDGITTRTQRLSGSMVAASGNTTALSNDVQSRTASGGVAQYSASKSEFSLPPSPITGTNLTFKPGVTLRSTSEIKPSANERTNVADYSNQIAERNVFGVPIAWKENVTISSFTPLTAGVEKQIKPGLELATTQRYSLDTTLASPTGSASISHWDPSLTVFQLNETRATIKPGDAGTEIDAQPGYKLITNSRWSLTNTINTPTGTSQVFYDDGVVRGYKTGEQQLQVVPLTFESGRQKSPLIERRTRTRFSTDPAITTTNGGSRVAKTDGVTHIYAVDEDTFIPGAVREYGIILQASTPAVLLGINISPIPKLDGSSDYRVVPYIAEGYRGSFQGKVREYWTETPPDTSAFIPITFTPQPMIFNGARLNFNIAETLHGTRVITEIIGDSDPVYASQVYSVAYGATSPTAIPSGWQPYGLEVDPQENGGYRVREISILYKA